MWFKILKCGRLVRSSSRLADEIKKECIVPDVIDCAPDEKVTITYTTGASVDCGNELTPTLVRLCPSVHWYAEYVYYYTICMVDPDVPCRQDPICREWQHWLVGNIPGNCINSGEVLTEYVGACPQIETGLHRNVFLVYKQLQKCCFDDEPRLSKMSYCNRDKFSIRSFACKYNLGEPIAANFFLAQFDCYVPLLNKQLGFCET